MANWTVARPGQILGSGSTDALFLKVFSGEVLTTFTTENIMLGLTQVRTISSGKSAQFPVIGSVSGGYHVPGTEIVGQAILSNEKIITIDDLLIAHATIAKIDEAKNHYDVRSTYTSETGRFLSKTMDSKILRVAIKAARTAATLTGDPVGGAYAGTAVTVANMRTDATVLKKAIKQAAINMDASNVPSDDRVCILPPAQYYLLLEDPEVTNKFYGENGSIGEGKVNMLYGVSIRKSNNVPQTNIASVVTGENNDYTGDFTKTVGVVLQKGAVGTVKLLDISTEMEYSVSRQAHLVVSKYAVGHGILQPQCAVELAIP